MFIDIESKEGHRYKKYDLFYITKRCFGYIDSQLSNRKFKPFEYCMTKLKLDTEL